MRSVTGRAGVAPAWRDGARAFPLACWGALGIVLALLAAPGRLAPPADSALRRHVPLDRRVPADLRAAAVESAELLATDDDRRTGTLPDHGDGALAAPPAHGGLALARRSGPHAGSFGGAAAARIPAPPRAPPRVA